VPITHDFSTDADLIRVPAGPGSLHVERYGQGGESIVLLHGFATSGFVWRAVAPGLAAAGHTVYAVDLMGYGESDRPLDGDYSIAAQAEYVDRALTELRLVRPFVAGLDVGGAIVQRLAAARGPRLAGLVLINSLAFEECPGRDVRAVQRATARFAFRVARGVLGAAPLLREALVMNVAVSSHMPDRLIARYLAPYAGRQGVTHLLTLASALDADDLEELDLGSIQAPALIVWGSEDRALDSGLAERLQAAIPGSTLVRLEGVGRLVPEEAPEILLQLMSEFVASNVLPDGDTTDLEG